MQDIQQQITACHDMRAQGLSRPTIAKRLGLTDRQVKSRIASQPTDPAIQRAMDSIKTNMVPSVVWDKSDPDYSVLLRPDTSTGDTDWLGAIADAFDNITPAEPLSDPATVNDDLITMYPVFDMHFGMLAWDEETGGDSYDTKLAESDMNLALNKVCAITPNSGEALLLIGGDFFHADDSRAETPASRQKLDVDGRHARTLDLGVNLLANMIDKLRAKHSKVTVRVMRGNHDEHSHIVLTVAISQRYRLCDDVIVDVGKRDLFYMQWGTTMIAAHHGDKGKPEKLVLALADECPFWSDTTFRYVFTGHVHHRQAIDMGAILWESLRAFCPPDSYSSGHHYSSRREFQSVTFHKIDGLVLRAYDPIRRVK